MPNKFKTGWIYTFGKTDAPKNIAVMRVKIIDKQKNFVSVVPINDNDEYIDNTHVLKETDIYKTKKKCLEALHDFLKLSTLYFYGMLHGYCNFQSNDNILYMHGFSKLYDKDGVCRNAK